MSEQTTHRIINGDCRNMRSVTDKSVQLIITSPPYWQLKDYGVSNQIGFDDDYEAYINNLNVVWKECFRVLDDGCRLCINVGDQFARSVYYGRYKVIPIHSEIIRFCETIGFDFMGQIIWQKSTTMNTTGGGAVMGSFPFPRNGIVKLDFEYILLFKKQGKSKKPTAEQKELSKMTNEEWNTYFAGHWHFAGSKQDKHLAMFPDELPRRLIKMFSFVGETVLDPFAGSGTTAKVARELGRNSVNYEINSDFMPLIETKLGQDDFFSSISFETDKTAISKLEIKRKVLSLPYQFEDVHKLDKTANIKSLQYGSKIDIDGSKKREELYSVREVISPEVVELNTGTTVRLIGIKRDVEKADKAVDFMYKKFKGRKVFLKSDTVQYGDCHTPAYLYLDNKTFINAHLLKYGYAHVDISIPFMYMEKFIKLQEGFCS
ncbi:MAG: site-specific DNA-methyltransferase [Oscillospiraceae bacterium]|nr:site-specific DNA-methyltransferase [Oscillospiraceae bacterium]